MYLSRWLKISTALNPKKKTAKVNILIGQRSILLRRLCPRPPDPNRLSLKVKFVSCLSADLLIFLFLAGKSQQTASLLSADK
jgi:hypothetical protein